MFSRSVLSLLVIYIGINDAARILAYFPAPSISHQVVFRPLTQELAKRGHEVIVITPDPAFPKGKTPKNLKEIDVHDLSYNIWNTLFEKTSTGDPDLAFQMGLVYNVMVDMVERQLSVDEVQKMLKENKKFDLLMIEACVRPALVLSQVVNAPVIQVSSFGPMTFNVETMGSAMHLFLYPNHMRQRLYNMTTWEKLVELYNIYRIEKAIGEIEEADNVMGKRLFGPDTKTISELKDNVHMLF
ncbi:hypothetical protein HF086_000233 [Spodoptera exigua]|uniref:UDP-glycosyltransferase n=1 Tax=Spodoptera exigua TaxID=7107 RepID=A0A922MCH0_SPOEX|nr:hypothetical protein HF086_000233 [Spodoptera exigua]